MNLEYYKDAKTQKDNPFCKMRNSDRMLLKQTLLDRLLWVNQLGSSRDEFDKKLYDLLAVQPSKKDWGSAPNYNNAPNTGVAILAGAIDKLDRGDLSFKQLKRVELFCEVLNRAYARRWSAVTFTEKDSVDLTVKVPFENLFEYNA